MPIWGRAHICYWTRQVPKMTCRCRKGTSGERIYTEHPTTSEGLPMSMVSKHYYEWSEQLWMNGTLVSIMIMIVQGNTSTKWRGWSRRLLRGTIRLRWFLFATGKIQTQREISIQIQMQTQIHIQIHMKLRRWNTKKNTHTNINSNEPQVVLICHR